MDMHPFLAGVMFLLATAGATDSPERATLPRRLHPSAFTVLDGDPRQSDITSLGDTVTFTLHYVDARCEPFEYRLEMPDDSTLRVVRVTEDSKDCDPESEFIYGVAGSIADLPPRKYLVELISARGAFRELLYHDVVEVR